VQNQSNVQLIAESALSEFVTGDNCGVGLTVVAAAAVGGQDGMSNLGQNIAGVGQLRG